MAISETARKNHDELFPGHVSTLADTDSPTCAATKSWAPSAKNQVPPKLLT
jgi:hypothetical protein